MPYELKDVYVTSYDISSHAAARDGIPEIDGIKGGSRDQTSRTASADAHGEQIELDSFSWGATQTQDAGGRQLYMNCTLANTLVSSTSDGDPRAAAEDLAGKAEESAGSFDAFLFIDGMKGETEDRAAIDPGERDTRSDLAAAELPEPIVTFEYLVLG